MNRLLWIILSLAFAAAPAFGQTVYKCPQPDGKITYQKARCPEGGRIVVQDNGNSTGNAEQGNGLRPGEQATLDNAKQREEAKRKAAAEARREAAQTPRRPYSVMDSQAWKGNERIIQESTQTINALRRLQRR